MKTHPINLNTTIRPPALLDSHANSQNLNEARELKKVYSQFVGENFYGMMLKSMRKNVGKPAYFHGGQAEEMFRGRLDQQIAQDLASSPNNNLADTMFEHQFPQQAKILQEAERDQNSTAASSLAQLDLLTRR